MDSVSLLTELAAELMGASSAQEGPIFDFLQRWRKLDAEARRAAQLQHLRFYLRGVSRHCPYYGRTLSPLLAQEELTWSGFQRLPLINRATIQAHGAELKVARPRPPWRPISSSSTSGSTGTPIVTEQTLPRSLLQGALARIWHLDCQRDVHADTAFINEPHPPGHADPPSGRKSAQWAGKRGSGRAYLLTLNADPDEQLAWLREIGAKYLVTYPSNLRALLEVSRGRGSHPSQLREVMLSSEPIPEALVQRARALWDVQVTATYSCSELGAIALQGADGGYVTQDASVLVEILRDDGSAALPGETGRVVVTTLQEMLRPLIRYELGDYAEVAEDSRQTVAIRNVVGRERTMIRTRTGRRVWPYFELGELAERGVVKQWQLVQHVDRSLTLRVVAARELGADDNAAIGRSMAAISEGLPLRIVPVDQIERTTRGKYREVISELEG